MSEFAPLLLHAEQLLQRLESLLPTAIRAPDWQAAQAFRWRRLGRAQHGGQLVAVSRPHHIDVTSLSCVDEQKLRIEQNTRQFVAGYSANNVLLTGARGTGKSSLVKAMLAQFAAQGLRLIEVEAQDLVDLPEIIELISGRPERFIIFCDDLSFESGEPGYKALKSALDGSLAGMPDNLLIYATSNRRHLMPEYMDENLATRHVGSEVHPQEGVEEKISLSERFGLWLSFYPFSQEDYLAICRLWLRDYGLDEPRVAAEDTRREALQWAQLRGSRSGRVAWQFARDYAGRLQSGALEDAARS